MIEGHIHTMGTKGTGSDSASDSHSDADSDDGPDSSSDGAGSDSDSEEVGIIWAKVNRRIWGLQHTF